MKDLAKGHGEVYLPEGLDRKYPNAGKDGVGNMCSRPTIFPLIPVPAKFVAIISVRVRFKTRLQMRFRAAEIPKHATVHTLRLTVRDASFNERGEYPRSAGTAGPQNVETTMIYTHVLRDMSRPEKPLDTLLAKDSPQK